jgi:hypothetical protein
MATKRVTRIESKSPETTEVTEAEQVSTEQQKSVEPPVPTKLPDDARVGMLDNGNVLAHFSFADLEVRELSTRATMHLETWISSLPTAPGTLELLCKLTHLCLVNAPQYADYETFAESLAREDFDVLALVSCQFRVINKFISKPVL